MPPDNNATKLVPIRRFPDPPGDVLHAKPYKLPFDIPPKICIDNVFRSCYHADDCLDGEKWDPRTLGARPTSSHEKYLRIALEIAARL